MNQFCFSCGAGIGTFRREGEGTCPVCDPVGTPQVGWHRMPDNLGGYPERCVHSRLLTEICLSCG